MRNGNAQGCPKFPPVSNRHPIKDLKQELNDRPRGQSLVRLSKRNTLGPRSTDRGPTSRSDRLGRAWRYLRAPASCLPAAAAPMIPTATSARAQIGRAGACEPPPAGTAAGTVAASGTATVAGFGLAGLAAGTVPASGATTGVVTPASGTTTGAAVYDGLLRSVAVVALPLDALEVRAEVLDGCAPPGVVVVGCRRPAWALESVAIGQRRDGWAGRRSVTTMVHVVSARHAGGGVALGQPRRVATVRARHVLPWRRTSALSFSLRQSTPVLCRRSYGAVQWWPSLALLVVLAPALDRRLVCHSSASAHAVPVLAASSPVVVVPALWLDILVHRVVPPRSSVSSGRRSSSPSGRPAASSPSRRDPHSRLHVARCRALVGRWPLTRRERGPGPQGLPSRWKVRRRAPAPGSCAACVPGFLCRDFVDIG